MMNQLLSRAETLFARGYHRLSALIWRLFLLLYSTEPTFTAQTAISSEKQPYVEGLRGIAAVTVYLVHAFNYFYIAFIGGASLSKIPSPMAATLGGTPLRLVVSGAFAVYLFWVLSGYVLALRIMKEMSQVGQNGTRALDVLVTAVLRRYFRLVAPVFVACLMAFILFHAGAYANASAVSEYTGSYLASLIPQTVNTFRDLMYHAFFEVWMWPISDPTATLWTMHGELVGSFFVFLFAAVSVRMRHPGWAYGCAVFFFLVIGETSRNGHPGENYGAEGYMLMFLAGLILAHLHICGFIASVPLLRLPVRVVMYFVCLFVGLHAAAFPPSSIAAFQPNWWMDAMRAFFLDRNYVQASCAGAPLLVFVTLCSPVIQRILSTRVCVNLGRISFALYLCHHMILSTMGCSIFTALFFTGRTSYDVAAWIAYGTTFVVIMIVSYVFARLADEKCGVQLSLYLVRKLHVGLSAVPVTDEQGDDVELKQLDQQRLMSNQSEPETLMQEAVG